MLNKKWIRRSFTFKHVLTIIAAMIIIVAAMFLYSNDINSKRTALSYLNTRNYNYSVLLDKKIGKNTYSYYDKRVSFSLNQEMNETINASILMRLDVEYDENDLLFDCVEMPGKLEVVISNNVAKKNNLYVDDFIYSSNRVTNDIDKYKIKSIIPDIYNLVGNTINDNSGLIIIGYDETYEKNMSSNYLYFYFEDNSLIDADGALVVEESLTSVKEQVKGILAMVAIYIAITFLITVICFVIMYFVLYFFNKEVYFLKREMGCKDCFKVAYIDNLIYMLISSASIIIIYLLISFYCKAFEFIEMIIILLGSTLGLFSIIMLSKKQIRGR